jgi:murein DD-endopeptidase MepM/ murein hydrolase activator NlpD
MLAILKNRRCYRNVLNPVVFLLLLSTLLAGCFVRAENAQIEPAIRSAKETMLKQPMTPSNISVRNTATSTVSHPASIISETTPTGRPYFTPSPPLITSTHTPSPTSRPEFCTPLAEHTLEDLEEILTNPFKPPPTGKDSGHHGVDFAYYRRGDHLSILGVTIQSVMAGRIAAVIVNRIPYGNMVIAETPYNRLPEGLVELLKIPEGQSLYLLYAHMKEAPLVQLGKDVQCGQALGQVGNTPKGWSSDPHLHFETRIGPARVAFVGMDYYDTGATVDEMANYRRWRMSGEFTMLDPMLLLEYGLKGSPTPPPR